mgnify:CR=1 FL=1
MKKQSLIVVCILCGIAICLSTWALVRSYITPKQDIQYTMYIGTNDKNTFELEMTLEEARNIVHNTMMDYFLDGFTMYDANGVWKDENNVVTLEYTFVCVIQHANKKDIYKAADELIEKLNQNSILIVSNSVDNVDFYTGRTSGTNQLLKSMNDAYISIIGRRKEIFIN